MKRSEVVDLLHRELKRIQKEEVLFGRDIACELISFLEHRKLMKPPVEKRCPVLLRIEHVWEKES